MLEKPHLRDERIITCLQHNYGLNIVQVAFLPVGADQNTAVYRVATDDKTPYFLKLRRDDFDETSVTLPTFFSQQGIDQIIAPLTSMTSKLWASLDTFTVILYPFVEGRNGYEVDMLERHWHEFGAALKSVHTANVPPELLRRIRRESYGPWWREVVRTFLERIENEIFDEPVAVKLAAFLMANRAGILDLVGQADRLAHYLQSRSRDLMVCHSDVHAGNILIDGHDTFYIVDWDEPILAPKERDLMFIGGGQGFRGHPAKQQEALFYQGYGQTQIDPFALAYYRYERIVEDIALYCEQIFLTNDGGEDREQALRYLKSNFLPNSTIEIAYQLDKATPRK